MNVAPLDSALLLVASPAPAQGSPEDNDERPVQAHLYGLTPRKPRADVAASLTLPRGHRAAARATRARLLVAAAGHVTVTGDLVGTDAEPK